MKTNFCIFLKPLIENKTSEALKIVINKVYDNIMEKRVQKKQTEKVNFFTAFDWWNSFF